MLTRLKSSLTLRIFLLTFGFIMLACAITYGAIAYLTPISYTALLEEELDGQAAALVADLEKTTAAECREILERFAREKNAGLRLTDSAGLVWFDNIPQAVGEETVASEDATAEYAAEEGVASEAVAEEDAMAAGSTDVSSENAASVADNTATAVEQVAVSDAYGGYERRYAVAFADGQTANLEIVGAMKAVNQATEAMRTLLPYLTCMALALSLLGACLYSRTITRPIVALSRIAGKMAAQDFGARWQKKRSDEIGALGESLNHLSENLSGALEQLRKANAALQSDIDRERELERQRTAFFAAASHELKTPVTILRGQISGMLAQVGVYQDREKYLARALQVTARMDGLIREILTISRIESSHYDMQKKPVDLSSLLKTLLAQNAELIEQREMLLTEDICENVFIYGNEGLFSNALDNVLMNAILYSPPGAEIRVRLDTRLLCVENTRAHIPEDTLSRIFRPFARVEPSRSRASGGSGLGLYLVRCIMDLHGIPCRLENTDGGVRFTAEIGKQSYKVRP